MNRRLLPALLALPLLMIGCGDSNPTEEVSSDAGTSIRQIGSIIEGVTDEASAKAAVPGIQAAITQFNQQLAQLGALKNVPAADLARARTSAMAPIHELPDKITALKGRSSAAAKIIETEIDVLLKMK